MTELIDDIIFERAKILETLDKTRHFHLNEVVILRPEVLRKVALKMENWANELIQIAGEKNEK